MVVSAPAPASDPTPAAGPITAGATGSTRWRKLARVALIFFVILGLLLWALSLAVPYVIKTTAPNWLKEKTGRILVVRGAAFNPLTLRLRIDDAALSDAGKPLARFNALEIKGDWASLKELAWTTEHITLDQPEISARIAADSSLDWVRFLDALPKDAKPNERPSDKVPRILLRNIAVNNAAIRLTDERPGASEKRLELTPLTFKLDRLSTLPRDRGDYALQATLNDKTKIQWKGRVGLNPIESSGDVGITDLPLTRVPSIANVTLPVAIGGTVNLRTSYSAAAGTDFVAAGIGDGVLEVNELRVTDNKTNDEAGIKSIKLSPLAASFAKTKADGREQQVISLLPMTAVLQGLAVKTGALGEPLLSVAQIATVKPVAIDLNARTVDVPQVTISELVGKFSRDKRGRLSLPFAELSASSAKIASMPVTPKKSSPNAISAEKSWRVSVGEIATDRAALALRDQSFAVPQTIAAKLDLTLGAIVTTGDKPGVNVLNKRLSMTDITLRDEAATNAWLSVKEVRVAPVEMDLLNPKIDLPKIDVASPVISISLDKEGVDIARKFAPAVVATAGVSTPSVAPAPTNTPPKISIAGVALNGGRVSLTDSTLPNALTHVIDAIRVNVDRIELDGSRPLGASANATLGSGGELQAKVKFDQRREGGEAEFTLEKFTLPALSPYLNRNTKLKLNKGEAAVAGRLKFSGATNADEALQFDGNLAVRELELIDDTTQAPFAQWRELSSRDVKVSSGKKGLDVVLADLLLDGLRGKLIIAENGAINLTQIAKLDTPATAQQAQTASTAKPTEAAPLPVDGEKSVRVSVDRLQVTSADVEFADLSLRPQFGTRISDLSGLIVGLSTEPSSRAEVSLEGKVDEYGLARVSGNLSPLGAAEYTDIKAIFRNVEMKNLTPYSGKFAGRRIESGKLSLDLEYKIDQRKLKGENKVVVDNLVLGERIDSKDATSLPLDLAIALLRDSNGMIELGLPVQGSLDDPQFNFGGLVWKVIVNVLTKIVTAPFRALGALLGGGEEFEAVNFEPGEARLLPPEREKLAKLAKALEQRPQLKLAVEGRFDKERDREALADNIVKLDVSKRAGMKPPAANEPLIISFTDAKVQAALDELAAGAGDDATKLRAQYLPPASNAVMGALQNARERLSEKGRTEAADARSKYYPELFKLLRAKQAVPDTVYATLATFRAEAVKTTLTAVNKFDAARVSVAAPQPVKASKPDQVATTLALSVK